MCPFLAAWRAACRAIRKRGSFATIASCRAESPSRLQGDIAVHSVVSQGCKPIGEPLTVTQAEKNVLLTLGSRPAYEVLSDVYKELTDTEREQARGHLFAGIAVSEYLEEYKRGDFLVRQHHRGRSEKRRGRDQRGAARGPDVAISVARFARRHRRTETPVARRDCASGPAALCRVALHLPWSRARAFWRTESRCGLGERIFSPACRWRGFSPMSNSGR